MRILIAEDEAGLRKSLEMLFQKQHSLVLCEDGNAAFEVLKKSSVDLVISDHQMPGMTGLELLQKTKEISPSTAFILISAYGSVEHAVEAIRKGADDYLMKPFELAEMKHRVARVEELRAWKATCAINSELRQQERGLIGRSYAIQEAQEFIRSVAAVASPVLLLGPSGSGKEVIARGIHAAGPRGARLFIAINCASLKEQLMDSELFGHERGAFTGATTMKQGKFELADGGTLFLDEIGELSLSVQANLLRVLQEKEFYRVGGVRLIRSDARVIAATHRDLRRMVQEGSFREDLYFRLNVLSFKLPPLYERPEDLPLLIEHFWKGFQRQFGTQLELPEHIMDKLLKYRYPGNIRELQNILERLSVLGAASGQLKDSMLPHDLCAAASASDSSELPSSILNSDLLKNGLSPLLDAYEKRILSAVMQETSNNQAKAALVLKITRAGLHYKLKKLGVSEAKTDATDPSKAA